MFNLDKQNVDNVANRLGAAGGGGGAGGGRRHEEKRRTSSRNVRAMQLFHELKQQFPTIPDHILTERIHSHVGTPPSDAPQDVAGPRDPPSPVAAVRAEDADSPQSQQGHSKEQTVIEKHSHELISEEKLVACEELRGDARSHLEHARQPTEEAPSPAATTPQVECGAPAIKPPLANASKPPKPTKKMCNNGASASHLHADADPPLKPPPKRPTTLNLPGVAVAGAKEKPSPPLNAQMNVSFQCESSLQLTPSLSPQMASNQRSFTSVNLTLRPPTTQPQAPIDITSKNASLTYSTASFDSQKGLESRLQITVSPNGGSVSSYRRRPHSYHDEGATSRQVAVVGKNSHGSLQDLSTSTTLKKQQSKLEKLRIELQSEKCRLIAMQKEVADLETGKMAVGARRRSALATLDNVDNELEKQLLKEIRHLRVQCERLTEEVDQRQEYQHRRSQQETEFYRNIYVGQRVGTNFGRAAGDRRVESGQNRANRHADFAPLESADENDGQFWSCPKCTFQNHPLINKCEQCDMAHIVHVVAAAPGDNIHIHVTPRITRRILHSWVI